MISKLPSAALPVDLPLPARKQPLAAGDIARYTRELTAAAAPRAAVMSPAIPAIQKLVDHAD